MMNKTRCGIILMVFSILVACQEQVDWDLEMENELRLVVNGKITDEAKAHEVKLTLPVYEMNGIEEPVSGAIVQLSDGDSIVQLKEDSSRLGIYITEPNVKGEIGRTYYLQIEIEDYTCFAVSKMEPVSPIKSPVPYKVQNDPPLYEVYFKRGYIAARTTLELDWSDVSGYDTLPDSQNHAIIYGYDFGIFSVDVNELFSPAGDHVYFPPGTKAQITKESLSEGYAEYLRGLLSETTWNGGLFDVKPGDTFTNLSNGAIGYFAATSVTRDYVIFNP